MNRNGVVARLAALLLLWFVGGFLVGGVEAAEAQSAATVQADSGQLRWISLSAPAATTLSLADPLGEVRRIHFQPGETPAVSLFDAQGAALPDGIYTWELRVTPPTESGPRQTGRQNQTATPRVISGHFTLAEGSLVDSTLPERPEMQRSHQAPPGLAVAPDQMVPDDLIVDGKGCIGLGCANNESFLNETLRLKQSVVRLRFEDTSAAGFAGSDWQLTANDVGSGGANRFSLEDLSAGTTPLTVFGGAPTSSVHVSAQGNVGLGTAVPNTKLHVTSAGAGTLDTKLLIENTGPAACREMFEIRNNGCANFVFEDTTVPERWVFVTFSGQFAINNQAAAGIEFSFLPNGNLTVAGNLTAANFPSSSRALKENFVTVDPDVILAKLVGMPVTEWSFKEDAEHRRHLGPTVEDFQETFGLGTNGQSLVVTDVNGVALASIQALNRQLEGQRQTMAELASVLAEQRSLIEQLRARLEAEAGQRLE